jgi:hypothetical protein
MLRATRTFPLHWIPPHTQIKLNSRNQGPGFIPFSQFISFPCVCVLYVCMWWGCTHLSVRSQPWVLFLRRCPFSSFRQCLSLAWNMPQRQDYNFPALGLAVDASKLVLFLFLFYVVLGTKLRSLQLHFKHFTYWTISPVAVPWFLSFLTRR